MNLMPPVPGNSHDERSVVPCQVCAEPIYPDALKCPFCGFVPKSSYAPTLLAWKNMSLAKLNKRTILLGVVIILGLNFTAHYTLAYLGLNPLDYRSISVVSFILGFTIVAHMTKTQRIEYLTLVAVSLWAMDFIINVLTQYKPLDVWIGFGVLMGIYAVAGGYLSSRIEGLSDSQRSDVSPEESPR